MKNARRRLFADFVYRERRPRQSTGKKMGNEIAVVPTRRAWRNLLENGDVLFDLPMVRAREPKFERITAGRFKFEHGRALYRTFRNLIG